MTKLPNTNEMDTNIWSSVQMAGTGGALKALAKNLANQLNLTRTEMKRVVARVISERHGQGDVGDYNGHMFYVKPDRIDMAEQITHSKEALDEMLNQKRMQRQSTKGQTPRSQSGTHTLTYNLSVQPKPNKSLTGVIIDQNHLQKRGNPSEIVVQMSKLLTKTRRSTKRKIILRPKKPITGQQQLRPKITPKPKIKLLSQPSKLSSQKKSKPNGVGKKGVLVKAKAKTTNRNRAITKQYPHRRQKNMEPILPREPAGAAIAAAVLNTLTEEFMEKKTTAEASIQTTSLTKKKSSKKIAKSKSLPYRKNYDQPWLHYRNKSTQRLTAGGVLVNQSHSKPTAARKVPIWRNAYHYQGGAGAVDHPNTVSMAKSKVKLKSKQLTGNNNRRAILKKRSQLRLTRELENDEAIDDLDRIDAVSLKRCGLKSCLSKANGNGFNRRKSNYKLSTRLKELAKPIIHNNNNNNNNTSVNPELVRSRSRSPLLKLKPRRRCRRVVVDSSLGSIEVLRFTSRSGLTPAKRNLTLAFLDKDDSRTPRTPRSPRSMLWR